MWERGGGGGGGGVFIVEKLNILGRGEEAGGGIVSLL